MVYKSISNVTFGTLTEIDTGTGLTGGPITASGTISIAPNVANTLAGFNNLGVFSDVTIGSGLSLFGGQLSATGSGTVTSINVSGGSTGLTTSGGPVTTSGTITVSGTLSVTNGGSGSNLSATGGTSQIIQQATKGGVFTVGQIAASALSNGISGSGAVVLVTSPTIIAPALGTPTALVGTNITGTAPGLTAGNVTTNANLTGVITSVGNITSIATQTGTGTKFVVDTSPTLVTPVLGSASGTSLSLGGGTSLTTTNQTGTGILVLATSPTITTGALGSSTATTQAPSDNSTKVATTAYVDNAVLGQDFKEACKYATTAALPTVVYANGSSGVGATLTGFAVGALSLDSQTPSVNDRVLVKNQASTLQNGIYTVTAVGSGIAVFVMTRATDFNQSFEIKTGDSTFVTAGATQATTTWAYTGADSPAIGTDAITFVQTAGQGSFTAGNGISITGTSIAIDTAVTVDKTTVQTITNKTLTAPIFTSPVLGTPASGVATNLTGTAAGLTAGNVTTNANLTGVITSVGNATSIASQTGTGTKFVVDTSPTLITPILGTPTSGVLTNCTGLPVTGGGTGLAATTAYAVLCGGTTTTAALQSIASGGTSGQVLTSNGAGSLPTFQAGGSTLSLLATATASASSALTFTSKISSSYSQYIVVFQDLVSSMTSSIGIQCSLSNGSSYTDTTMSSQKSKITIGANTAPTYTSVASVNPALITTSNSAGTHSGWATFTSSQTGGTNEVFVWESTINQRGQGYMDKTFIQADDALVNAFEILPSAGNFTSGKVYLYGVKNT